MADILYFPPKPPEPPSPMSLDLGAEGLHGAAAILASLAAKLMVCPKDRATRLAVIEDAERRLKLVQLCLDLTLIAESRR
jgi:hypothetical protein